MKCRQGSTRRFLVLVSLVFGFAVLALARFATAGGVGVHVGVDIPLPGLYLPPPPVVALGPPVVIAPPPVVVPPRPVVYAPPAYGYYYRPLPPGHAKRYYRHHKHHRHDWDD